jgi:hypothetical protein
MIHVEGINGDFHFDLYNLTGRIVDKGQSSGGDILRITELVAGVIF